MMKIMSQCYNSFWKDVCKDAIRVYDCMGFSLPMEIIKAPLCGNTLMNVPTQYHWIKFGIVELGDLYRDGIFMDREDVNDRLQGTFPYITYRGLIGAIPKIWKNYRKRLSNHTKYHVIKISR